MIRDMSLSLAAIDSPDQQLQNGHQFSFQILHIKAILRLDVMRLYSIQVLCPFPEINIFTCFDRNLYK